MNHAKPNRMALALRHISKIPSWKIITDRILHNYVNGSLITLMWFLGSPRAVETWVQLVQNYSAENLPMHFFSHTYEKIS